MPTYDYKCENCHERLETFQRMTEEPLRKCPNCGLDTLVRVVTGGAGVLYKGEGWYVTDYSHKSSGGKDDGSAPAATPAPLPKDSSAGPVAPPAEPLGAT